MILNQKVILRSTEFSTLLIEKAYEECEEQLRFMTRVLHKPRCWERLLPAKSIPGCYAWYEWMANICCRRDTSGLGPASGWHVRGLCSPPRVMLTGMLVAKTSSFPGFYEQYVAVENYRDVLSYGSRSFLTFNLKQTTNKQ